jgi:hypothetical protein
MEAALQPAEFEVPMERVVADYNILQPVTERGDEVITYEVVMALDATRDQDVVVDPYDPYDPKNTFVPEDID